MKNINLLRLLVEAVEKYEKVRLRLLTMKYNKTNSNWLHRSLVKMVSFSLEMLPSVFNLGNLGKSFSLITTELVTICILSHTLMLFSDMIRYYSLLWPNAGSYCTLNADVTEREIQKARTSHLALSVVTEGRIMSDWQQFKMQTLTEVPTPNLPFSVPV